jgi:hypothetical protein
VNSLGKRNGGRRRAADEEPCHSFAVVIRAIDGFRQFSPLASQIQPLIAKLAIANAGGDPLALKCALYCDLHSPFHRASTRFVGFCSTLWPVTTTGATDIVPRPSGSLRGRAKTRISRGTGCRRINGVAGTLSRCQPVATWATAPRASPTKPASRVPSERRPTWRRSSRSYGRPG